MVKNAAPRSVDENLIARALPSSCGEAPEMAKSSDRLVKSLAVDLVASCARRSNKEKAPPDGALFRARNKIVSENCRIACRKP